MIQLTFFSELVLLALLVPFLVIWCGHFVIFWVRVMTGDKSSKMRSSFFEVFEKLQVSVVVFVSKCLILWLEHPILGDFVWEHVFGGAVAISMTHPFIFGRNVFFGLSFSIPKTGCETRHFTLMWWCLWSMQQFRCLVLTSWFPEPCLGDVPWCSGYRQTVGWRLGNHAES